MSKLKPIRHISTHMFVFMASPAGEELVFAAVAAPCSMPHARPSTYFSLSAKDQSRDGGRFLIQHMRACSKRRSSSSNCFGSNTSSIQRTCYNSFTKCNPSKLDPKERHSQRLDRRHLCRWRCSTHSSSITCSYRSVAGDKHLPILCMFTPGCQEIHIRCTDLCS